MYKIMLISLLTLSVQVSPALAAEEKIENAMAAAETAELTQARQKTKELGGALKQRLQAAMKEGGPENALQACNIDAPKITASHSDENSWKVGRTSLKVRNPANKPDAWEKSVLNAFEQRKLAGENINEMEQFAVVEQDGESLFRYMKAIPTAPLCLTCHGGDEVNRQVISRLQKLYPNDQARGFKAGDIRGAFTLSRKLNQSDSH